MSDGLFISFEGVDGAGKTTQVNLLADHLRTLGREVVVTREPGGTALGTQIRAMLLTANLGEEISPRTEALLFAADRAQHVSEVVRPALERGAIVITDRYLDSSLAYQSGGRELTADDIRTLSMWATNNLLPARTYLLDIDPRASHAPRARRGSHGIRRRRLPAAHAHGVPRARGRAAAALPRDRRAAVRGENRRIDLRRRRESA